MASLAVLENIVSEFPGQLQTPVRHLAQWTEETLKIPRQDFLDLQGTVGRLAAAQERTEQKVEQLAAAQEKLTAAQERTEQRLQELAEGVRDLAVAHKFLSAEITKLGSRWGIYNEGTFRTTIRGLLREMEGVTVKEGYYGDRQVDVVIRDGEHLLLEITSRMHSKDIENLYRSADDYRNREGVKPKLMIATSYVSPKLMQKIMGLERPIEIFSYEEE